MKKTVALILSAMFALCVFTGCNKDTPRGKVEELEQLKGRVVYSIGQGNVPDLVFRYLLKEAGVNYRVGSKTPEDGLVSLAYVQEGSAIVAGLGAGTVNYGVISEPAATQALNKVADCTRMLDIQALYNKVTGSNNGYPQAALVIKKSFLRDYPNYAADFAAAFKQGAKWAESEPEAALAAIKSAGSTTVPILNQTVAKGCNLGFTSAYDAKNELLAFYAALDKVKEEGENPVGNVKPADEFFVDANNIKGSSSAMPASVNVYAPDGAPAIGMAKLIADGYGGANFHVIPPANIGSAVLNGNADIAVMPANAAATLYNKADIVMLGVTNWGSLYMVGRE